MTGVQMYFESNREVSHQLKICASRRVFAPTWSPSFSYCLHGTPLRFLLLDPEPDVTKPEVGKPEDGVGEMEGGPTSSSVGVAIPGTHVLENN